MTIARAYCNVVGEKAVSTNADGLSFGGGQMCRSEERTFFTYADLIMDIFKIEDHTIGIGIFFNI